MNTFTETQRFRQPWVWLIIGFSVLIFVGALSAVGAWNKPMAWLSTIPMVLVILLLYVWRLDTRLDKTGVHYRVFPLLPWRTILWNDVKSATVHHYDFAGYGIRWSFDGWVYNVAGNKGLYVVLPNNRQITIGTQRPDEVEGFLRQLSVFNN